MTAAALDSAALDQILRATADRLDRMNPGTIMSPASLHSEVQLSVWGWHGIYNDTMVGRDINTVLGHISDLPLTGTRAEYALRLRLMLAGVTV